MWQITVRAVFFEATHEIAIAADAPVGELRAAVCVAADIPAGHRLRLIHAGRMLEDGRTLAEANVINSSFVHCSATAAAAAPKPAAAAPTTAGTYVQMGPGAAAAAASGDIESTMQGMREEVSARARACLAPR
jgi:hypothetical protein